MGWLIFLMLFSIMLGILLGNVNYDNNKRKNYLLIIFSLLALFAGLRGYQVGIDTINYVNMYKLMCEMGISAIPLYAQQMEIGFLTLAYLLSRIFSSPTALLLTCSGITCFALAKTFYDYSEDVVMSSFLYIVWFYTGTLNIMRQYVALSIILLGIPFVLNKKPIKYVLCVILATTFHSTAIIFVVFVIFALKIIEINRKVIALTVIISAIAVNSFEAILNIFMKYFTQYQRFLNSSKYASQSSISIFWLATYIAVAAMSIYIISNNEKHKDNVNSKNAKMRYRFEYQNFFLIMYLISIVCIIFSGKMWIVSRINSYFRFTFCLIFPIAIRPFYGSSMNQRVFVKTIVIVFFGYFAYSMFKIDGHSILPYMFFWN